MRAITVHAARDLRIEPFTAEPPLPASPPEGHVRVAMEAGGICGSDLHYVQDGGFGLVRVAQPMALGHEASGRVAALGAGVVGLGVGDLVAVNPSQPCGRCDSCVSGQRHHCTEMRFNGSAMRFPHVQGLFRGLVDVPAERAFALPARIAAAEAALCEPLAVALHAVRQAAGPAASSGHGGVAGLLDGRRVLVSGCGPIGILVIVAARLAGAAEVIAADIAPHALAMASTFGAAEAVDMRAPGGLAPWSQGKGSLDVAFECSGSPRAFAPAIAALRPRGTLCVVGIGGDVPVPMNSVVAKELSLVGSFRFDPEFAEAARLVGAGAVDLKPMISGVYPFDAAHEAFDHAADKARATKIVIDLTGA